MTAMDFSVTELTVKSADPVLPPKAATIFVVPGPMAVATPPAPTVATEVSLDVQVASVVRTCVLESLKVPVAVNANSVPGAMVRPVGETEIDTMVASVTSSVVVPLIVPKVAVMVAPDSGARPLASPLALPMGASVVSDEVHVTSAVRLCVLPSLKVPVAENCWVVFCAMIGLAGRTAIDVRLLALTVAETLPLIAPEVAVTVKVPRSVAVASPLVVIEATLAGEVLQTTVPVMFCVLLSENVPVAVNCCTVPSGMELFPVKSVGVTLMEVSVALVTVKVALADTVPNALVTLAVIWELPATKPMAKPDAPFTLMLTTDVFEELQVTDPVTFCVLLSVRVPVAVNCTVVPLAIDALVDETVTDLTIGAPTVTVTGGLVTPESEPVMFAVPCESVVTTPAETVATFVADEVQVTVAVRSWLVPSLYLPVAVSWSVRPSATDACASVIWIDDRVRCATGVEDFVLQAGSRPRHRIAINTRNFFINFSPESHG